MAKFTFADGSIFEGTVEELADYARLAGGAETDQPEEIEGPVRVGDTIEITEANSRYYTRGKRYAVLALSYGGCPKVIDDTGDKHIVSSSKYRIVARKEETPQPAKPSVKVGDYIVSTGDYYDYTTEGKAYEVVGIDGDGGPLIEDDDGDEIGLEAHEYRIITDARELAFAKAGRKLNEFKKRDIVRIIAEGTHSYRKGELTEIDRVYNDGGQKYRGVGVECPYLYEYEIDLIAPAEARVDGE